MLTVNQLVGFGASGAALYRTRGRLFDTTPSANERMVLSSPSGAASTPGMTFSCWFRKSGTGTNMVLLTHGKGASSHVGTGINGRGKFFVKLLRAGPAPCLDYETTDSYNAADGWHHVVWSVHTTTAAAGQVGEIAIDGAVVGLAVETYHSDNDIDPTAGSWYVGINLNNSEDWLGDMAQLFVHPTYIDLNGAANLARFYRNGPVDFGSDGSGPLGSGAWIYQNDLPGDAASVFGANHADSSLGNFTITGTLTESSLHPYEV